MIQIADVCAEIGWGDMKVTRKGVDCAGSGCGDVKVIQKTRVLIVLILDGVIKE